MVYLYYIFKLVIINLKKIFPIKIKKVILVYVINYNPQSLTLLIHLNYLIIKIKCPLKKIWKVIFFIIKVSSRLITYCILNI